MPVSRCYIPRSLFEQERCQYKGTCTSAPCGLDEQARQINIFCAGLTITGIAIIIGTLIFF